MKILTKLTMFIMFIALSLSLISCSFFGLSVDEAKANLEEAGYQVSIVSGEEYVQREDAFNGIASFELEAYLYAIKGDDVIHMFFFNTIDYASDDSTWIHYDKLSSGQNNNCVYYGTKQAIKDSKI